MHEMKTQRAFTDGSSRLSAVTGVVRDSPSPSGSFCASLASWSWSPGRVSLTQRWWPRGKQGAAMGAGGRSARVAGGWPGRSVSQSCACAGPWARHPSAGPLTTLQSAHGRALGAGEGGRRAGPSGPGAAGGRPTAPLSGDLCSQVLPTGTVCMAACHPQLAPLSLPPSLLPGVSLL